MRSAHRDYLVVSFVARSRQAPAVSLVVARPDPRDQPIEDEYPGEYPVPSARERARRLVRREEREGRDVILVEVVGAGLRSARVLGRGWSARVRRLRHRLAVTQQGLGLRLGLSWKTIAKWETGLASPPPWHPLALHRLEADAEARGQARARVEEAP